MNRRSDAAYGNLFTIGAWLTGIGLIGSGAFFTIGGFFKGAAIGAVFTLLATVCAIGFAVGIFLMGFPMLLGAKDLSSSSSKKIFRFDDTIVIARYALNGPGEMLFDESYIQFDDRQTRLFVRLQPPNQNSREYRCNVQVWYQCGEGMKGVAYIQGDWVGQFTPTGSASGPRQTYSS